MTLTSDELTGLLDRLLAGWENLTWLMFGVFGVGGGVG